MTLRRVLLLGGVLLAVLGAVSWAPAQPDPPVERFDLVLFGSNLGPASHRVALRTNPWRGGEWATVAPADRPAQCTAQPGLRAVPNLSAARYLGQDIRENYIALRVTVTRAAAPGTLRAAYAVPSADTLDAGACERLATLIAEDPAMVRRHSIATYVRPRPVQLSAEAPFIEHLEAPVRHRKPGVMEVEWLEILFAEEE
ncbi:MAG: hypothetical protein ABEL04_04100 [Salinibacter sp.]|uniref:hypothetical protein n=1 Tax=Salinibacter sp. TaxID=2065818 RepID=UPI0035D49DD4